MIVVAIGAYHYLSGVSDLGLFLMGLGSLQLLFAALVHPYPKGPSGTRIVPQAIRGGNQNLDLMVGMGLALACGILSLAGSLFFIIKGQTPPYYGVSSLEIQWSGLMMGLLVGPLAVLVYGLMYLNKYFLFSLVCLTAATFTAFYVIGYSGGLIGVSAIFFAILSKDEFVS